MATGVSMIRSRNAPQPCFPRMKWATVLVRTVLGEAKEKSWPSWAIPARYIEGGHDVNENGRGKGKSHRLTFTGYW
jgi:hypothetical protein